MKYALFFIICLCSLSLSYQVAAFSEKEENCSLENADLIIKQDFSYSSSPTPQMRIGNIAIDHHSHETVVQIWVKSGKPLGSSDYITVEDLDGFATAIDFNIPVNNGNWYQGTMVFDNVINPVVYLVYTSGFYSDGCYVTVGGDW